MLEFIDRVESNSLTPDEFSFLEKKIISEESVNMMKKEKVNISLPMVIIVVILVFGAGLLMMFFAKSRHIVENNSLINETDSEPTIKPSVPTQVVVASVLGVDGTIESEFRQPSPFSNIPAKIFKNERLVLIKTDSTARVTFKNGSKVNFLGMGSIVLTENGFGTHTGKFSADFNCNGNKLSIQTPFAVIGVRGTTINFDLKQGIGFIHLIHGKVTVSTVKKESPPFEMIEGSKLQILFDGSFNYSSFPGKQPTNQPPKGLPLPTPPSSLGLHPTDSPVLAPGINDSFHEEKNPELASQTGNTSNGFN
ncbi:MAG: FecR domain-containing protein [Candidatus Riflebacteria bacterium]|nr:FecR domain-containing protein [Candidatus Riflebacteria bacterium]